MIYPDSFKISTPTDCKIQVTRLFNASCAPLDSTYV
jgi:hypothetical protein